MPITAEQYAAGANKQMEVFAREDPVDQIGYDKPLLKWLIANKKETSGGNTYFNEKVHIGYDSNYQNYSGDDQVTYNRKDTVRLAKFPWFSFHDGFGVNEDEMAENGIILTDDRESRVTDAEKFQIYDVLKQNYSDLKDGAQEKFNFEMLQDGTQDPKAAQGLDFIVSLTPAIDTVGGLPGATSPWWRNNVNGSINLYPGAVYTPSLLIQEWEDSWYDCVRYGKMGAPDKIIVGDDMYDAYRDAVNATNQRQITIREGGTGGPRLDGSTGDLYFKGVMVERDPSFAELDTINGGTPDWSKRAYFLNKKTITLRPLSGHWMINRKPPRMYDRYVHYFAMTSKYRLTIKKRNANAVLKLS